MLDIKTSKYVVELLDSGASSISICNAVSALSDTSQEDERLFLGQLRRLLNGKHLPLNGRLEPFRLVFQNATEEDYSVLADILGQTKSVLFHAVCGELLWIRRHERELGRSALLSYYAELDNRTLECEYAFARIAGAICRIYPKIAVPEFPWEEFLHKCINFISIQDDMNLGEAGMVVDSVLSCGKSIEGVDTAANNLIEKAEQAGAWSVAIECADNLERYYRRHKRTVEANNLVRVSALLYEKEARTFDWTSPADCHHVLIRIEKAIREWKRSGKDGDNTERKRLAKEIEPVKKLAADTMKIIQTDPFDISAEIQQIKSSIECAATPEELIRLIISLLDTEEESNVQKQFFESDALGIKLFGTNVVNKDGRTIFALPPLPLSGNCDPKMLRAHIEYEAMKGYCVTADAFVNPCLQIMRRTKPLGVEDIRFLVESSVFVPGDRQRSFLSGLHAGLEGDYITAMHLLMPQVENAVRVLAETCGAVVYKPKDDGSEECFSLSCILEMPELVDCLDERLLFNMRVFYSSVYGFGMRDAIAHSFLSDDELQSANSIAVWAFTLYLCCYFSPEMWRRINAINSNNERK